ncbi:MAG: hypothetical protein A2728_00245 [Candidatus Spechtbacteria bacterium RIFCSPHIGHO2_01_FULL_38_11]|nr:MAG: hypothetical protein A2728_00245 [Candidatus Spechtbacteria bacterium RIFCSPHIGHO2_01_FULL_38_11]
MVLVVPIQEGVERPVAQIARLTHGVSTLPLAGERVDMHVVGDSSIPQAHAQPQINMTNQVLRRI